MTTKPLYAAAAAVSFAVLFFGQSAHATDHKTSKPAVKPPVPVVVQPGDSLSSIAEAHNTTYIRLFNANDSIGNPDLINPGDKVRIPVDNEDLSDRFGSFASAVTQPVVQAAGSSSSYSAPRTIQTFAASSAGNTYYQGQCTWYVKNRRPDLPNRLGNGGQWVANAAAQGFATGSTPRAGAVGEQPGHVVYVESVNGDGTVNISEMNYNGGVGVVHNRTVAASTFTYIY
jgi:surface antigen